MDYKNQDLSSYFARDAYLKPEEIEMRQLAELHQLMENWRDGLSVWEVMWQLEHIMHISAFGAFENSLRHSDFQKEEDIEARRERLRPFIYSEALQDPVSPQVRDSIDAFIKLIEENDDLSSYDLACSVVRTILRPVEDFPQILDFIKKHPYGWRFLDIDEKSFPKPMPWLDQERPTPLDIILQHLERDNARLQARKAPRVVGSLCPQPEGQILNRLTPFITKMHEIWLAEGAQKLIKGMSIEATGSGQIKPHLYNPNYLPREFRSGDEDVFFDPYGQDCDDMPRYKEDIYGTEIAIITTYAINFTPRQPEQLLELAEKVRMALRVLGIVPPAFAIPTDYEAEPYQRPFYPARSVDEIIKVPEQEDSRQYWSSSTPKSVYGGRSAREVHCGINIHDGQVKVHTRLDLDDIYVLYYLLEDYMELNTEIAQSLNTARFLEARSAPMMRGGLDTPYSNESVEPDKQVGNNLTSFGSSAMFHALEAARDLYYGKNIDEAAFLEQVMVVAAHSLSGSMADPVGVFPTFDRMLSDETTQSEKGGALTLQVALKERTRAFLNLAAGLAPDSDVPVANALYQQSGVLGDRIREKWRLGVEKQFSEIWNQKSQMSDVPDPLRSVVEKIESREQDLKISDIVSGYAERKRAMGEINEDDALEAYAELCRLREVARDDNPNIIARDAARIQVEFLERQDALQDQEKDDRRKEQKNMPQLRTGLVLRDPEVPNCADRVYSGTIYTSRLRGSYFPRRELPYGLARILDPRADPFRAVSGALIELQKKPDRRSPEPQKPEPKP